MTSEVTGIRGAILHFVADPFYEAVSDCYEYFADGLLVLHAGKVAAIGSYASLIGAYEGLVITHYADKLIVPGLIDTHVHYPQTEMIAAYGEQLLSWLERYTFPTEQKFSDRTYALSVAEHFLDELLRHGTTTALVFTTVYAQSTDAFFEAAQRRNLRMIAGKVLMDRNAPAALLDTPEQAYAQSKQLIEQWHGCDRLLYAITPRFAITSTPEQLQVAGQLLREFPGVYLHTHLAENQSEIAWTQELFPDCAGYLDVYERYGLVGDRSVFAHGIYLGQGDWRMLSEYGCAIAHCPTSNLFLGSGLFPLHQAKDAELPVEVGLGTDIGAGTSFSLLHTAAEAYKVAQLQSQTLSPFQALYLATLGGAKALSLDDKLGNFLTGKEADFVVLDPVATATLAFRNESLDFGVEALESILFSLLVLGDDRAVLATYIAGDLAYQK